MHGFGPAPEPKKQIFCSRSFSQKITSSQQLQESVANYAVRAAEKLRRQHSLTQRIYVMLQSSRFKQPYYSNSAYSGLPYPSNDSREIVSTATRLCQQLYQPDFGFARAGVGLLDLIEEDHHQADFFTQGQSDKSKTTMAVIDQLNQRYGKGHVFLAVQGTQRKWAMAREMKSPAYSTRFSDIPIVKL
ncbi:MAG: DUF4113 domain-containing protein [Pseudomonadales bacterium]|nr:DUF4113 domain-containing protein [Pseudomonadales bacterium]